MENLGMSEGLRFTIFTENLGMRHVSTSHSMPPQGGEKTEYFRRLLQQSEAGQKLIKWIIKGNVRDRHLIPEVTESKDSALRSISKGPGAESKYWT